VTVQPRPRDLAVERPADLRRVDAARYAQRRAWFYICAAFAIWCTLFTTVFVGANTWRKTAYSAPPAQLLSKRGIVLYQGPRDERPVSIVEPTDLEEGGIIDVPANNSEAVVQLRIDNSTATLRPGSRVRLATMRVGRFSPDLTQVRFEQLQGAVNYAVSGELPSGREVEVKTPHMPGATDLVKLTKGDYLIWVQSGGTRVASYFGQAKAEISDSTLRLRDGRWVVIGPDRSDLRQPLDLPEQLVKNRDFSRGFDEYWSPIDIGERGRPDVGGHRSIVQEFVYDRPMRTLRVTRDTAKNTHNETGLAQEINRDVSAFRGITFSAWVKVNHASLDGGGYVGSEYPMMFRVHYVAENGGNSIWAHGFYVKNTTNRPADLGEEIPANEWHRFTLDMNTLKERPAFISKIEVLASGHDFDAQVANVQLAVE
jgi:hypothetical protein